MEELCYYLYHHVYLIDDNTFSDSLIDWIGSEVKLSDRADKLKLLKRQKADLKTIVTVVLCSSDYYTEQEIKSILKTLDEIIGMPQVKRNVIKANLFLDQKKYTDAAVEYEHLLTTKEAADLTPEEYGDILHNLAVARVHITGLKDAPEIFSQAYERNRKEASLRQYLYAVKLNNNTQLFTEAVQDQLISREKLEAIQAEFEQLENEAGHCPGMADINQLKQCKSDGRISEFYQIAEGIIDSWKMAVRQN
jgi:tetratricopeptide (TPR) repeat protein